MVSKKTFVLTNFSLYIFHFTLSSDLSLPKIAQTFTKTKSKPTIKLLHFITVMLENPRIHGESMIHAPSTSWNQLEDIDFIIIPLPKTERATSLRSCQKLLF